ncbi:MAG: phospholipase D-like domain-containing protein [Pseudomonadota bacterium]
MTVDFDLSMLLQFATIVLSLSTALHALLHKRDSRAALGWIALCLFAPIIGPLTYIVLGINRAHRQANKIRAQAIPGVSSRFQSAGDDIVRKQPLPSSGNAVVPYFVGTEAYDAMLAAIDAATTRVWLSQYIFESRGIGATFIAALGRAATRGVQVCVLLDRVGALYSIGSTRRRLRKAGVQAATFLPIRLWPPALRINLRNHRKILLIDDGCVFTGGMNVRNGYLPGADNRPASIRDTHFRIEGPLVADFAAVFQDDWQYTTGTELAYIEQSEPGSGSARCRLTVDGPDNSTDLITVSILSAIASAENSIRVMTPYFLPPIDIVSGLQMAAVRGVDVSIVLPETNNLAFVHWAMQHDLPELLRYDIKIFFQRGSFDHSKLLTIDDRLSVIGSFNIDPRSLRLNFEIGVEVWDDDLAHQLNTHIDRRIASARRLSMEDWRREPSWKRLRNAIAWLGSPYL